MIPRIFEGQPVVVVAGGPSLAGFSFNRLRGLNTIAINRAHEQVPGARVLWWSDAQFWRSNRAALVAHAAPFKATCQLNYLPGDDLDADVHVYRFTGLAGFDPDPGCLRHGNNGAFAAMHLAAHLGASKIILLGVDMRTGEGGRTHYHSGYGHNLTDETYEDLMLPHFRSLAKPLADRSIRVFNASPQSGLMVWPRCSIDEGLSHAPRRTDPRICGTSEQG